ncbi:phosphomevalonate kinase [Weissella diestrammenae]|uniref:phosphomevalonate kinase n=1 Tax=Weissella diestrammenae TaxID=1162633 RepID=A0A7G9T4M3_9LACO|nr:phosphomevalonate kinase [Weissella diestrammenae]MCM0582077.1 phosphomevalonate kinase [Weissella diestrammenae]QNN75048.1 phosphomevalonate kinase [Weissella diestrammenae]
MTVIKIPGKLFLAGEYANTDPGQPSIVFAVNRFITFDAQLNTEPLIVVTSDLLGYRQYQPDELFNLLPNDDWRLIQQSLSVFAQFMMNCQQSIQPFKLNISSDLTIHDQKIGLGSSGATVIGIIKSLFILHQMPHSPLTIYKLAAIVLHSLPNFVNGSMGDLAAAAFSGLIYYQKFDHVWLTTQLQTQSIASIITEQWPCLVIQPLIWPTDWHITIGWTQKPANTQIQLNQITTQDETESTFQTASARIVKQLVAAINTTNWSQMAQALIDNRQLLSTYTQARHIPYQTPKLVQLMHSADRIHVPSKISGAGNGDNGLAIVQTAWQLSALQKAWQAHHIMPLPLSIYTEKEV